MAAYRAEGIVLKKRILGESDRIVSIFARNYGKISAVAKGARKARSRLGGRTELFIRGNYQLAEGRNLDIVTQAEIVEGYNSIRADLYLTAMAAYFIDLVDSFTGEREAHDDLYDLLMAGLAMLEHGTDPDLTARIFEVRLMDLLGYRPQLESCSRCGSIAGNVWTFDISTGGVVCGECRVPAGCIAPISINGLRLMRLLLVTEVKRLLQADIPPELLREVERTLAAFIDYRSEGGIRSRKFLALVREEKTDKEVG